MFNTFKNWINHQKSAIVITLIGNRVFMLKIVRYLFCAVFHVDYEYEAYIKFGWFNITKYWKTPKTLFNVITHFFNDVQPSLPTPKNLISLNLAKG